MPTLRGNFVKIFMHLDRYLYKIEEIFKALRRLLLFKWCGVAFSGSGLFWSFKLHCLELEDQKLQEELNFTLKNRPDQWRGEQSWMTPWRESVSGNKSQNSLWGIFQSFHPGATWLYGQREKPDDIFVPLKRLRGRRCRGGEPTYIIVQIRMPDKRCWAKHTKYLRGCVFTHIATHTKWWLSAIYEGTQ